MAVGRLRGLVATASLDLGIDWGDVDLVIQMGAPKGSSRLLQRIGRANHRLDEPSSGIVVPGNRFEYLEARAAIDAVEEGELTPKFFAQERSMFLPSIFWAAQLQPRSKSRLSFAKSVRPPPIPVKDRRSKRF